MKCKYITLLVFYILMMFFTNSYIVTYRWEEWASKDSWDAGGNAAAATVASTAFWPIYWTGRASLWLVSHPPTFTCNDTQTSP